MRGPDDRWLVHRVRENPCLTKGEELADFANKENTQARRRGMGSISTVGNEPWHAIGKRDYMPMQTKMTRLDPLTVDVAPRWNLRIAACFFAALQFLAVFGQGPELLDYLKPSIDSEDRVMIDSEPGKYYVLRAGRSVDDIN